MFTPTSKLFLPVAWIALFLGTIYKILSGDLLGSVLFFMVGTVAFVLGVMLSTVRENEYVAAPAPTDPPPVVRPVAVAPLPGGGGWPVVGGLVLPLVMLGLIQHPLFTWAGVLLAILAATGWLARSASETTGRPISLLPLGLPVLGLTAIASVMYFMSRILLAVSETASWVFALLVAVVIMIGATFVALRPHVTGRAMAAMLAIGSLLMMAGGTYAAALGEREIEHHEPGHGEAALVEVKAQNVAFSTRTLTLKADAEVEIKFDNNDNGVQHNISIIGQDPTKPVFRGSIVSGVASVTYKFHAPAAGEYRFQCDVHPGQMTGTVTIA